MLVTYNLAVYTLINLLGCGLGVFDFALETRYEYDAAGRIDKVIQKQDGNDVTTTYTYDVMGRRTATTTNNIATVGW